MMNTGKRGGGSTVVGGTTGVAKVETLGGAVDLPLPPLPRPRPDIPMAGEEAVILCPYPSFFDNYNFLSVASGMIILIHTILRVLNVEYFPLFVEH